VKERLQKILSARGVASRRKAEEYIEQGFVKVNGIVATLGQSADPDVDTIEVDGKILKDREEMLYYVMNKPEGVETTNVSRSELLVPNSAIKPGTSNQKQVTRTVRDLLPPELRGRIFPVGRLDKDSSGLLFFTNDGVLSFRLTHPKFDHEKEYEVVLDRAFSPILCRKIEEGFEIDGKRTKPIKCRKVAPNRARVVLTEGKNRQVRRMFQHLGFTVKELRRVRIMTFRDESLKKGTMRALTPEERTALLKAVAIEK
jgi:23S rRNA pseudouridine2605 synthase